MVYLIEPIIILSAVSYNDQIGNFADVYSNLQAGDLIDCN